MSSAGEREHKCHRARAWEAGTGTGNGKESSRKTSEEGKIQKKFQSVIEHVGPMAEHRNVGLWGEARTRDEDRNEGQGQERGTRTGTRPGTRPGMRDKTKNKTRNEGLSQEQDQE